MYRRSILPVSGAEKWPKLIFWEPATFSRKTGHAEVELYDRDVSSYFLLLSGCSLVWMAPFFYLFKIISQIQISMKQTLGPNIHTWKQHLYHFRLQKYKSVFTMYLHLFKYGAYASRLWVLKGLGKLFFFTSETCLLTNQSPCNNVRKKSILTGEIKTYRHNVFHEELFPILLPRPRDQVVVHLDDSPWGHLEIMISGKVTPH